MEGHGTAASTRKSTSHLAVKAGERMPPNHPRTPLLTLEVFLWPLY